MYGRKTLQLNGTYWCETALLQEGMNISVKIGTSGDQAQIAVTHGQQPRV